MLEERQHRREDSRVSLAVEVLGVQEIGDLDDRVSIDEDRAEDGLLGIQVLWRQSIDHGWVLLRGGGSTEACRPVVQ